MLRNGHYSSALLVILTAALHAGAFALFVSGHATAFLAAAWLIAGTLTPHLVSRIRGPRLAYTLCVIAGVSVFLCATLLSDLPPGLTLGVSAWLGLFIAIWQLAVVYATRLLHQYVHEHWV